MKSVSDLAVRSSTSGVKRRRRATRASCAAMCIAAVVNGCSDGLEGECLSSTSQALLGDGLVISQVYFGKDFDPKYYNQTFIELFNRSAEPVSLNGLSIQFGSTIENFGISNALPNATIPPGGYFLASVDSTGTQGEVLPPVDFTGASIAGANAVSGKAAIARSVDLLACGAFGKRCSAERVVDMIGWNSLTTDYEGKTTSSLNERAAIRKGGGCIDTNNNRADFDIGAPTPRNAATPVNVCPFEDAGSDAGAEAGLDGSTAEVGTDGSFDASNDRETPDAGGDASGDSGVTDAGGDASGDSGVTDPGSDASADSGVKDAGRDASADSGVADTERDPHGSRSDSNVPPSSELSVTDSDHESDSGCSSSGRARSSYGASLLTLGIIVAAAVRRRRHFQSPG